MPTVYKIIWCCPCLPHTAFLLTHFHSGMHVTSFQIKAARTHSLFHISLYVTVILSSERAVYEVGKRVSVFEVARGGECQQTSAPRYLGCKSSGNRGRNMQGLVQWLEVLPQLGRKWMEAAGEAHLHAVKLFSKHLYCCMF